MESTENVLYDVWVTSIVDVMLMSHVGTYNSSSTPPDLQNDQEIDFMGRKFTVVTLPVSSKSFWSS